MASRAGGGRAALTCLALGLALVGIIGTLGVGYGRPASGATATSFEPYMVTRAGSTDVLYVLWQSSNCAQPSCVRLERSANGGRTFTSVSTPPLRKITPHLPALDQLTFASSEVGYAVVGPSSGRNWSTYFLTTNGARTWKEVDLGTHATSIEIAASARYFYALTETCGATDSEPCTNVELSRSSVSSTSWTRLALPAVLPRVGGSNLGIAAAGSSVWITTQNQPSGPLAGLLATSTNAGRTFSLSMQRDLVSVTDCVLMPASTRVLWADCDEGNMDFTISYSPDGGVHWQMTHEPSLLTIQGVEAFDPISVRSAYFVSSTQARTLFRISKETSVPRKVATLPAGQYWESIVFTNSEDGVVMSGGNSQQLYGTQNGGASWRRLTLLA